MTPTAWTRWIGILALVLIAGTSPAWAQGATLKVALQGDTSDVDLHMTTHYVSRVALLNVYETLYSLGEDLSIKPMLVDTHTVSPDATVYTLKLRRGVKFHNGKTLDSKDVVYTLQRIMAKGVRSGEFRSASPSKYASRTPVWTRWSPATTPRVIVQSPPSTIGTRPALLSRSTASATPRATRTTASTLRAVAPGVSAAKTSPATSPSSVTAKPAASSLSTNPCARRAAGARSCPA